MSSETSVPAAQVIARVAGTIGKQDYRVDMKAQRYVLVADERKALGGEDAGPAPYEYLLSGLGACTMMTLRMYAARKGWDLRQAHVELRFIREGEASRIERVITLEGDLSEEQRGRLADIAERTPVTLTLKSGVVIDTQLRDA
ncbi:OsmC family protein [Novosphingobium album (ex Liu et al. 2023)]|uniref:OsmC family protein n=1 Tax=Novosphingobium album (ex Liu et al. 2023) TaxID=3031130 RepID=A0ABT5WXP0_9SPHN|nr:OsmC family protein [Novosphingobium album (ex Liu et al. 2023)]MDE8654670.1 OsmC family protein [Novosphingobium album (ex Liu et al. 2023)]